VLDAVRLHRHRGRVAAGRTLLEGPKIVGEAVARGVPLEAVFGLAGDDDGRSLAAAGEAEYLVVAPEVLAKVATTTTPQSPIAVIAIPDPTVTPGGRVMVAWGVGDPGNCGTLIRTAAAFGFRYLAGPGAADTWSPKVIRAAAGGHFSTQIGDVSDLDAVRSGGRIVVATVSAGGGAPGPLPPDAAILVGSEPHGLPAEITGAADLLVTIPMAPGAESLNAAVAGAIVAFVGSTGPGS